MTNWVIVGGGSAGSVVAARLSQRDDFNVTVIEVGQRSDRQNAPPGTPAPDLADSVGVQRRASAKPIGYAQGSGLGGSSTVNAAIAIGAPDALEAGHELSIELARTIGPVSQLVERTVPGATRVNLIARDGRRVTAADHYLTPALGRDNLTVRTGMEATRVVFEGDRAVGVLTASGDHIVADRVVMCAGAVQTPTILLRSNVRTPGVGHGLTDHVGLPISFDRTDEGGRDVDELAIGVTVERPGRQLMVIDKLSGTSSMGALLCGHLAVTSTGVVALPDLDGPPVVVTNQLAGSGDRAGLALVAAEGAALAARLRADAAIGDCYVDEHGTKLDQVAIGGGLDQRWLFENLGGYHHLAASCRVGVVLDGGGAVRGYDGLFVCDASALPRLPERNLYLTVIQQAERMAGRWLADR